jgi:FtsZ-interacting cell division protein ZipA
MASNTVIWIVIAAIVAIVLIALAVLITQKATQRRRRLEARNIRQEVQADTTRVEKREALAEETASKARAAQAEAEAKAAEAARLEQRAAAHREQTATSRDELRQRAEHADTLDPTPSDSETRQQDATSETVETEGRHEAR